MSEERITPFFIGIAGGTGSGKSTVAQKIAEGLPEHAVGVIDHDAYYREQKDLSFEERQLVNYDHPDSLETELLARHLKTLHAGEAVDIPIYDFVNHARKVETRTIEPKPIIIVEGILVFVEKAIRESLDVKIFVDTASDIRVMRRIRRDMESRGRTFQQVREQYYKTVRPMHMQFVEPSKAYSDLIIPEGGNNEVALDIVLGKLLHVLR
ncbi:MAG: uridine kinase [Myxococcales bacterium]|nr:uridine kinase [Myxococcales bacterium]|tara:strand:+ start:373 stop:1002 length:630 start_codon:yes stop_codon:yes gene_type:complete